MQQVYRHTLENGLTVLVVPQHTIPKVSMQLWYDVGAKDEQPGQRGVAHYIEHMIFKGTSWLSESDINRIVHKLSGSCNAFTSHDYTGYMFEMPSQHWYKVLPLMADCMQSCTFKQDQLSSELRAILQEIRMYRDDYMTSAIERLTQCIFNDHPYRHPIIGYQNELLQLDQDTIQAFYNAFYMPNNATLVVVGDTTVEDAVKHAEHAFGHIPRGAPAHQRNWSHQQDVYAHNVTLYRDVQQPTVMLTWEIPGFCAQQSYLWDILSWVLGSGKGSRLYHRLMTQEDLVTDIHSFVYDLFEYGQFVVYLQPCDMGDIQRITNIITQEIDACMRGDITDKEIQRAQRKTKMDYVSVFEDIERHAYLLGKFYLATGDENALYHYVSAPENLRQVVADLAQRYIRPSVMHCVQVLPVPQSEQPFLDQVQDELDAQDEKALESCVRTSDVEPTSCAVEIDPEPVPAYDFPKPHSHDLSNGARLLYYNRPEIDKIELLIDFKAKHYYDPSEQQGRYLFMSEMLQEGTTNYTASELANEIEQRGMSLRTAPGSLHLTALPEDFERGLEIVHDVLMHATFDEQAIERVRHRLLSDLERFWDTPTQFSSHLLRQAVYGDHPYHKNALGTRESISHITRHDLLKAYSDYIVPDGACISVVGNIADIDIPHIITQKLNSWTGKQALEIDMPSVERPTSRVTDYQINRDQTVLCYAGLSVPRDHEDFDPLLLFDQSFTGGVLDGMYSQLFQLREESGLFYAAGGSLLAGSGVGPGMVMIKSIVSNDRLALAQEQLEKLFTDGPDAYTNEDHEEAQQAIINTLADNFATQQQTAHTFVALERYNMPHDHFDKRPEQLKSIDIETVQSTAKRYLDTRHFITLRVGRVT